MADGHPIFRTGKLFYLTLLETLAKELHRLWYINHPLLVF